MLAGFEVVGYEPEHVYCWPENWPAFELFCSVSDQWLIESGVIIGLNASAVMSVISAKGLSSDLYDDVRAIAHSAITVINQKNSRR